MSLILSCAMKISSESGVSIVLFKRKFCRLETLKCR